MNLQNAEEFLTCATGKNVSVLNIQTLGGGCINQAALLETDDGKIFIKWNEKTAFPGMFEAEQKGLNLLRQTNTIPVPEGIGVFETNTESCLILEYIEPGKKSAGFWEDFGSALATMHRHTQDAYGLDHDNYIGSLSQKNTLSVNWVDFFIQFRLNPQLHAAIGSGKLSSSVQHDFDRLYKRLPVLFPAEPPALLHGDLWNGNYLTRKNGNACLIDPAVYYGHREMDIAMTKLFGGFDETFYRAYEETYPLEKGWKERTDLCNLYLLLVHVNLFGGGYAGDVTRIVASFLR